MRRPQQIKCYFTRRRLRRLAAAARQERPLVKGGGHPLHPAVAGLSARRERLDVICHWIRTDDCVACRTQLALTTTAAQCRRGGALEASAGGEVRSVGTLVVGPRSRSRGRPQRPREELLGDRSVNGFGLAQLNGVVRGCATADEGTVPRRANYGFEKRQKELKRQQKREEKAARKRGKREIGADSEPSAVIPAIDDLTSGSPRPDVGEANPRPDGVK